MAGTNATRETRKMPQRFSGAASRIGSGEADRRIGFSAAGKTGKHTGEQEPERNKAIQLLLRWGNRIKSGGGPSLQSNMLCGKRNQDET